MKTLVDRGIEAADEDAGDRSDAVDRLPRGDATLEAADVGVGCRFVALQAEDQRDVDVDSRGDHLGDRRDALGRRRNLDHEIRPVDGGRQTLGRRDRPRRVGGERRRDLEAHVPVAAVRRFVETPEFVERMADVVDRERFEERIGIVNRRRERAELLVVVIAARYRFFEDRRIRGHAAQTEIDQLAELSRREHAAPNVIQPDTLSGGRQVVQLRAHRSLLGLGTFGTLRYVIPALP